MNEDEAFIRAIVDSPGDDTSRLVYADWLDDRSDPRGRYLRAEHKWAKRKPKSEEKELRKLAVSLDAVWVARVSRPPLGVCVESQTLRRLPPDFGAGIATQKAIDKVAREFSVVFPPEYTGFLLNYNGGWIANRPKDVFPDESNDHLHSVEFLTEYAEALFAECHESNRSGNLFPIGSLPGAATGCSLLLGIQRVKTASDKLLGAVFNVAWGTEDEPWAANGDFIERAPAATKVADSLPAWFARWK